MKSQLNKLRKIRDKFVNKFKERNQIFLNRTAHWKESDNAVEFENKTYELESALNDLNTVIDSLENYVAM